jgi:hypothetical protein
LTTKLGGRWSGVNWHVKAPLHVAANVANDGPAAGVPTNAGTRATEHTDRVRLVSHLWRPLLHPVPRKPGGEDPRLRLLAPPKSGDVPVVSKREFVRGSQCMAL